MADATEQPTEKKKKKKIFIILPVVVLLLGGGGGAYFFMNSKKASAATTATTTTTVEGNIVRLSPITMNLSDGHVLKVGIALQMVEKPKNKKLAAVLAAASAAEGKSSSSSSGGDTSPLEGEEAKALDRAIMDLGDMNYSELSAAGGRAKAKEMLSKELIATYDGDVTGVYFTDFVMS